MAIRINLNIIQDLNILLGKYYSANKILINNEVIRNLYNNESTLIVELKNIKNNMFNSDDYTIINSENDLIYNEKKNYKVDVSKYNINSSDDLINKYTYIIDSILNNNIGSKIININIISYDEENIDTTLNINIGNEIKKYIEDSIPNIKIFKVYKPINSNFKGNLKILYDVFKDIYIKDTEYNNVLILYNYTLINDSYYNISKKNIYSIKGKNKEIIGKLKPTSEKNIYIFYNNKININMKIKKTYGSIHLKYNTYNNDIINNNGYLNLVENFDNYKLIKSSNFKGNDKENIFYIPKNIKLETNKINKEIKDKKIKGLDIFNLKNMNNINKYKIKDMNKKNINKENIEEIIKIIKINKIFKNNTPLMEREFNYKLTNYSICEKNNIKNVDVKYIQNYHYALFITLELYEKNDNYDNKCRNTLKKIEKSIFSLKFNNKTKKI